MAIMADTFGDPRSPESFMLPEGLYRTHSDERLQALAFPVIAFVKIGKDGIPDPLPIYETLGYLEERELWLAATIDASTHVIPDEDGSLAYKITSSRTSVYGRVIEQISADEAVGELKEGSFASARRALINCAFESHPLYERVQKIMDAPDPNSPITLTDE